MGLPTGGKGERLVPPPVFCATLLTSMPSLLMWCEHTCLQVRAPVGQGLQLSCPLKHQLSRYFLYVDSVQCLGNVFSPFYPANGFLHEVFSPMDLLQPSWKFLQSFLRSFSGLLLFVNLLTPWENLTFSFLLYAGDPQILISSQDLSHLSLVWEITLLTSPT